MKPTKTFFERRITNFEKPLHCSIKKTEKKNTAVCLRSIYKICC